MRRISVKVIVNASDGVTPQMIRDLLKNQLALNPVQELAGGLVDWRQVRVETAGDAA